MTARRAPSATHAHRETRASSVWPISGVGGAPTTRTRGSGGASMETFKVGRGSDKRGGGYLKFCPDGHLQGGSGNG